MTVVFLALCVSLSDTGTWGRIRATEAHNRRFLARSSFGSGVLCRFTTCLLLPGQVGFISQSACAFNFSPAASDNRFCFNICLSPHLTPEETTGIHDGGSLHNSDDNSFCGCIDHHFEDC
jgi:hypothetical protein